jgi:hypothetical protein
MMATMFRLALGAAALALALGAAQAAAVTPVSAGAVDLLPGAVMPAQSYPNNRSFRRCMRAKYGPRYFARVNRAHRWHMSQACMG